MSSALAIAATSVALQSILTAVFNAAGVGSVTVSSLAPDILQSNSPTLQVNLFLHQVTPNAGWRNVDLPTTGADGRTRLRNQPLALDLHYLLTAYGTNDFEAEALLGIAIQALHQTPVLARADIRTALNALPGGSGLTTNLQKSGLADQFEMMKVTPSVLGREEMAWLWTALKADYRPTFPFQVSVALIQDVGPSVSPLPVLQRSIAAQPNLFPALPTLLEVSLPSGQPAAAPGDQVTVTGVNLSGITNVRLTNSQRGIKQNLTPSNAKSGSFQFGIPNPPSPQPNPPTDIPAGIYQLTAEAVVGPDTVVSNSLAFAVAPTITAPPGSPVTRAADGSAKVTITCAPYLRPGQDASLLIGGQAAPADAITVPGNALSFTFPSLRATLVPVPVWLRVDGVDSPLINMTAIPLVFSAATVVVN